MEVIKYLILFLILIISTLIGRTMAKKYVYRVEELEEIKVALNILKTKILYTRLGTILGMTIVIILA